MQLEKLDKVIHSESDNVITNMKPILDYFVRRDWGIAYPLQADNIGCASVFLVNRLSSLMEFVEYMRNRSEELNIDDMKVLGEFARNKSFLQLPTYPISEFTFDAGTYGKYLLGADARNFRIPRSTRGLVDSRSGAIDPKKLRMVFSPAKYPLGVTVKTDKTVSTLVNLHIHSKRIPSRVNQLFHDIAKSCMTVDQPNWRKGRLDTGVALERILSAFCSRILRKKIDIRLR
jgi:hypothetical protein